MLCNKKQFPCLEYGWYEQTCLTLLNVSVPIREPVIQRLLLVAFIVFSPNFFMNVLYCQAGAWSTFYSWLYICIGFPHFWKLYSNPQLFRCLSLGTWWFFCLIGNHTKSQHFDIDLITSDPVCMWIN